jgi:hypothetical protein
MRKETAEMVVSFLVYIKCNKKRNNRVTLASLNVTMLHFT